MSRTKFVEIDHRGFWALDDALDVWLAYLAEEAGEVARAEAWLADLVEQWRRTSALADHGVTMRLTVASHRERVLEIAERARRRAVAAGDLPVERLGQWVIFADLTVSEGFSRTPDGVDIERIIHVADGFIGLLTGYFPADPPQGWWYLGTGAENRIIERRDAH